MWSIARVDYRIPLDINLRHLEQGYTAHVHMQESLEADSIHQYAHMIESVYSSENLNSTSRSQTSHSIPVKISAEY